MIHRCARCDLEFVFPLPDAAELDAVYQRDYFTGEGFGYSDYFASEHRSALAKAAHRIERLRAAGLAPGARVLDIGCADGTFVAYARSQGFDAYGVEVSSEAVQHAPIAVRERILPSLEEAARHAPFACITLWDVLEHLPDPLDTLRSIRGMLAPHALVGVVVPVIDNLNARWWPRSWDQYKPPEHIWFFSRRSLRSALEREIGQLVLEEGAWRRDSRCIEPFAYWARARKPSSPVLRLVTDVERWIVRGLVLVHAVPEAWVQDSVLMLARVQACKS